LDVRSGSPGPVTLTLSSNFCEVSGTLSDANGPVADAQIVLASADSPWDTRITKTDSKGAYKLEASPGKYILAVDGDLDINWGPGGPDLDSYESQTIELNFGDKIIKDLVRTKQ
jgi:hypothetical protein